jgi:hypothetical protein
VVGKSATIGYGSALAGRLASRRRANREPDTHQERAFRQTLLEATM